MNVRGARISLHTPEQESPGVADETLGLNDIRKPMTQRDSQNNPLQLPQQPPLPPTPTWLDLKVKGQSLGREELEFLTAVGRKTAQHRAADKPGSSSGTTCVIPGC